MNQTPPAVPTITPRPGGFEFGWTEENIRIRLERLRESRDSITAEIWVAQGQNQEHILGGLRFSLTTPLGRTTMAKTLNGKQQGLAWEGMIEQICVYCLGKFRSQEPLAHIGNLPREPELRFRLRPIIPEGMTTLIYGYGGVAKSTLAYAWGSLVQLGITRLGLEPIPGPVLMLDWETNPAIANRTLQALHAGLDLPGLPDFLYRRCRRPLPEFIEEVKADVEREGIGLVIVDSLAKACGGEKEIKENSLLTLTAIESLGVTNLIINHRPKGEEGKERGAYGSVFVENNARQAFRVEARHTAEEDCAHIALFHTKHNLTSPLHPIGYRLTWSDLWGTKIEQEDVGEMTELRDLLTAVSRIQIALKNADSARMTVEEIAEETGLKEDTIGKTLRRYRDKRFVSLGGQPAAWGLKAAETPEAFR